MKTLRLFSVASSLVVSIAIPAMAGVTVNAPLDSGQVSSPFKLSAVATSCSSEQVSSMGYSFDSVSDTTTLPVSPSSRLSALLPAIIFST